MITCAQSSPQGGSLSVSKNSNNVYGTVCPTLSLISEVCRSKTKKFSRKVTENGCPRVQHERSNEYINDNNNNDTGSLSVSLFGWGGGKGGGGKGKGAFPFYLLPLILGRLDTQVMKRAEPSPADVPFC